QVIKGSLGVWVAAPPLGMCDASPTNVRGGDRRLEGARHRYNVSPNTSCMLSPREGRRVHRGDRWDHRGPSLAEEVVNMRCSIGSDPVPPVCGLCLPPGNRVAPFI